MRNKVILGIVGAIILGLLIFIFVGKDDPQETITEPEKAKQENEEPKQKKEAEETNEESIVESDQKTKTPFQKYKHYGAECLEIEETIERGDCFQAVGEEHIEWYLNEDKTHFYFPYHRDQDHWHHVFYKEIDEDDQLGEKKEAEYFDDYVDPQPHSDNYERGEKVIDLYWHVFSNLIPQENREQLDSIYWTDTGKDSVFALGTQEDMSMFLALSHLTPQLYDVYNRYILIHEFGHMITLNSTEVDMDEKYFLDDLSDEEYEQIGEDCETLYTAGRCAKEDSYIQAYQDQFWSDIDEKHQEIDWENEDEFREFFFDHEEYFFNSYQATSVHEDIADIFSLFILTHSSITENSEVKHKKISFFYEYDELVELRTEILENLYNLSVEDGRYY